MKPYISDVFFCACLSLLESLRKVSSFGDRGWGGECWPGPSNWIKGGKLHLLTMLSLKICCRILSLRTDIIHNNSSFGFFRNGRMMFLRPLNEGVGSFLVFLKVVLVTACWKWSPCWCRRSFVPTKPRRCSTPSNPQMLWRFRWGSSRFLGAGMATIKNRSRAKNLFFVVTLKSKHIWKWKVKHSKKECPSYWAFYSLNHRTHWIMIVGRWLHCGRVGSPTIAGRKNATVFYIFWCFR